MTARMKNIIGILTGILTLIGGIWGGWTHFSNQNAWAEETTARHESLKKDVDRLEIRMTLREVRDTYLTALDELFFYQEQLRKHPEDPEIRKKLQDLEVRCGILDQQIKDLMREKRAND